MKRLGIREARTKLTRLVGVGSDERVVLTQYGREVGALVPASEAKLLERLDRTGELQGLKERYPEEV